VTLLLLLQQDHNHDDDVDDDEDEGTLKMQDWKMREKSMERRGMHKLLMSVSTKAEITDGVGYV